MTSQTPRLAWFFGLSFVLSWMIWIPMAMGAQNVIDFKPPFVVGWLAGISPALVALWLVTRERRPGGLRGFLRDRLHLRISPWVWLVALLQPFVLVALASTLQTLLTGQEVKSLQVMWGMLPMFTAIMLFLSLGEELGWRAYALPWLVQRLGVTGASLCLGVVWGIWHLPKFWMQSPPLSTEQIAAFLLQITAASFLFTWLVLESRGGVLPAVLYHACFNMMATFFPTIALEWSAVAVAWLIPGLVALWSRRRAPLTLAAPAAARG